MKIKFETLNDLNSFISGIKYYDGNVLMSQGKQIVNGRSLLGMYSLELQDIIDVAIDTPNPDTETDFYNFIKKWEVKSFD